MSRDFRIPECSLLRGSRRLLGAWRVSGSAAYVDSRDDTVSKSSLSCAVLLILSVDRICDVRHRPYSFSYHSISCQRVLELCKVFLNLKSIVYVHVCFSSTSRICSLSRSITPIHVLCLRTRAACSCFLCSCSCSCQDTCV